MTVIVRVQLLVLVVTALAACGSADPETAERSSGSWERLPQAPLSPRESAVALSIDGEALFIGGSDAGPCPPNASCAAPAVPPLRDGAAFDPGLRRWERIAQAPVGFSFAHAAAVDGAVYLLTPGEPDGRKRRRRSSATGEPRIGGRSSPSRPMRDAGRSSRPASS